jgi:membrane fusion protein (multidrug efflux system)
MRLSRIVKNLRVIVSAQIAAPLLLATMALALAGCGSARREAHAAAPPQVRVMTVEPRPIPLTMSFTGRLSAYREANVLARVAGVLLKRYYKEGTEVKAGQPLFLIDPAPYKAALDAALAAEAQARANAANARATMRRDRQLIPSHLISESQLDTDQAAERSTAAAVEQTQANVEAARINLGYTRVRSPIAGIAGEQQVTEGAMVGQGTPTLLTTVDQLDPIYVNFDEPASELEQLSSEEQAHLVTPAGSAAKVQLTLPDGTPYGLPGVLDFRALTVDPTTGTAAARGIIPNPDHQLLPGMFVDLRLTTGTVDHGFLVPQEALQRDGQGAYLLTVAADGTVLEKRVSVLGASGNDWIVSKGLEAGDRVIVSGIQSAHPGTKVTAIEETSSAGAGAHGELTAPGSPPAAPIR